MRILVKDKEVGKEKDNKEWRRGKKGIIIKHKRRFLLDILYLKRIDVKS
jgi:hypothetical protein